MASILEEQMGKPNREKEEKIVRSQSELQKKPSVIDIIDKKPVSYNKKKTKRIIFTPE